MPTVAASATILWAGLCVEGSTLSPAWKARLAMQEVCLQGQDYQPIKAALRYSRRDAFLNRLHAPVGGALLQNANGHDLHKLRVGRSKTIHIAM